MLVLKFNVFGVHSSLTRVLSHVVSVLETLTVK